MKKGFTLIELMVVIAIIAILSGIVLVNFASSRSKARDARRLADVTQLQVSLESYFKDPTNKADVTVNGSTDNKYVYPQSLSSVATQYISVLPKDPQSNTDYGYARDEAENDVKNQAYCLGAKLENENNAVIAQNNSCNGITWCSLNSSTYNFIVCRQ